MAVADAEQAELREGLAELNRDVHDLEAKLVRVDQELRIRGLGTLHSFVREDPADIQPEDIAHRTAMHD
jgi:hypothetical protein